MMKLDHACKVLRLSSDEDIDIKTEKDSGSSKREKRRDKSPKSSRIDLLFLDILHFRPVWSLFHGNWIDVILFL